MKCCICEVDKLSKEFPSEPLSANCEHAPLYCLRCATKAEEKCPYKNCEQAIDPACLKECNELINYLFPPIKTTHVSIADIENSGEQIFVSNVEGGRTPFPYSPKLTIEALKEEIEKQLKIEQNKQKLFFEDKDLEDFNTFADYGIVKGSTIHLMVLLYAIPDYLDHTTFDLSWNYPTTGRDFLDATCFAFQGTKCLGTVNYNSKSWPVRSAIQHSGDGMDDSNQRGFHTIEVFLKKVPNEVTHLFFTLSVWTNPSIAHFPNPILRFYDASNKTRDLCNTSLSHASDSEAVVMCYVKKKSSGKGWEIYESGQLSDGNANNYEPLLETVKGVISGRFPGKTSKAKVGSAPAAAISVNPSGTSSGPRPVEIAFSFDTTGSMYSCIGEVKKQVENVIGSLLSEFPTLRIGVLAHGDYDCPTPYLTTHQDLTSSKYTLSSFIRNVAGTPGGGPECYEYALHKIRTEFSWTSGANKSLVMIGDSTPHEKYESINKYNIDWKEEAKKLFSEKGVRIYAVRCMTSWPDAGPFWEGLAKLGHGKYLELKNFSDIVNLIKAICYREAACNQSQVSANRLDAGVTGFMNQLN